MATTERKRKTRKARPSALAKANVEVIDFTNPETIKEITGPVTTATDLVPGRLMDPRWIEMARMMSAGQDEKLMSARLAMSKRELEAMKADPRWLSTYAFYCKKQDEAVKDLRHETIRVATDGLKKIEEDLHRTQEDPYYDPKRVVDSSFRLLEIAGVEAPKIVEQNIRSITISEKQFDLMHQVEKEIKGTVTTKESIDTSGS